MTKKRLTYDRWEVWMDGKLIKAFSSSGATVEEQIINLIRQHTEAKELKIVVRERGKDYSWNLTLNKQ